MAQPDLGTATIVYDDEDGETVERTVQNERIAYFQDHWVFKLDEDDEGNDVVRRVPVQRVHHVDRSVETFEEEVETLRNQVESFAKDIQSTLLGGRSDTDRSASRDDSGDADATDSDAQTIEVQSEADDERR